MRLRRIRLLDRFIYLYLPEPRWRQALSLVCGVDPFGSAFPTRSFTLENLAGMFGAHSRPNKASLVQEALSSQPAIRSPFLIH